MVYFLRYETVWLIAALALLVPAFVTSLWRQALRRFSRKLLLERVPEERRESLEDRLARKDELRDSLEHVGMTLLLAVVLVLVMGRVAWLEGHVTCERGAGLWCLPLGFQVVNLAILTFEIALLTALVLGLAAAVIAEGWAEGIVLRSLGAMERLDRSLEPLRVLARRIVSVGAFLLAGRRERSSAELLEEELLSAMEESEREGLLGSSDVDMIESIIAFGDVEVSEVMTPRTEMVCLDIGAPLDENLEKAIECGHSRIPVYRETKDRIIGVLYVKDLLGKLYRREEILLEEILRPPYFVPLSKKISELLQEFKTHRMHIAIVLDEYGGTAGLVTIEDIIEEIVGEISDEYELPEPEPIRRLSPTEVEVDAALHIDDLNDELGIRLPEGDSYETVGGLVFAQLGRVPRIGEKIRLNGLELEVTAADERRVQRLLLRLPEKEEEAGGGTIGEEPRSQGG